MEQQSLTHWADILVIVLYFCFVLAVGLWTIYRPNRGSVKGYFLAGRDMVWWPVGASLFASNIGSEHFIGLAGTGAASGIAIVLYEWASMPLVMLLAWLFLPVYVSAGVFTLPEYLQKRFGGQRLRVYLSCLALVLYIVTKIAVCIFAGALFIQLALGWDMYLSIGVLLIITCLYTILGGLAAVIYTDTLQTAVMTVGSLILAIISFSRIGGYEGLKRQYMRALPEIRANDSSCGMPAANAFSLFRHPLYDANPWPGIVLQATIGCLWYWCADQVIVQRALAAKNLTHAKGGAILAGYLKLLPLFLMIFPGMISRALYPDEVGCVDPEECQRYCNNPSGCSNIAYPKLVMNLLPVGLRGLLLAVMMSAIMSSLTSIFNSASTLFTMDLWRRLRPDARERELLIVGRVCIAVLCVLSILWVPLVQSSAGGQLFVYIQAVQGYLGTPIGLVFLLAIFWSRMNEQGAFWGLLAGHVCGGVRMILDFVYPAPPCGEPDNRPALVSQLHYTYFSQLNLILTGAVIVVVTMATSPHPDAQIKSVTWWTRDRNKGRRPRDSQDEQLQENGTSKNAESIEMQCRDGDKSTAPDGLPAIPGAAETTGTETSFWRRWFEFVCGVKGQGQDDLVHDDTEEERMRLLREVPFWRKVVNGNAIFALTVMAFLLGFFH